MWVRWMRDADGYFSSSVRPIRKDKDVSVVDSHRGKRRKEREGERARNERHIARDRPSSRSGASFLGRSRLNIIKGNETRSAGLLRDTGKARRVGSADEWSGRTGESRDDGERLSSTSK